MKIFLKKCEFCKEKFEKTISRTIPVYGYTEPQRRSFCSKEHADLFEQQMIEFFKPYKPGCRTCY